MSRMLEDLDTANTQLTQERSQNEKLTTDNARLERRVQDLEAKLQSTNTALDALREQSGKGQDELRGLLADRDDKISLLEGQLAMMEGANQQLGSDVRRCTRRLRCAPEGTRWH